MRRKAAPPATSAPESAGCPGRGRLQRLRLTAPQLDGFGYLPGQDVMLLVAAEGNRPVRRRYTIRQLDAAERLLTLDIVRRTSIM